MTESDINLVRARADSAIERARRTTRLSQALVIESRRLRRPSTGPLGTTRFFAIHGEVEGKPVRAAWSLDRLIATGSLLRRAEILVQLGEDFEGAGGPPVAADLERPGPAVLTMVRACDRVREVSFGPIGPIGPIGPAGGRRPDLMRS